MKQANLKYDVIIPLAKKDVNFVHWVVEYVRLNFVDAQSIYIITNASLFPKLKKMEQRGECVLIDENKMLEGLSYSSVCDAVVAKNQRAGITGHYFEQFLKMGFSLTPYCKDFYLSWDSDTIPLNNIDFFRNEHPLFAKKKEYRKRYFEVMEKVLGIGRQMDASFIAEHMMFKASIMREIITEMDKRADKGRNWWQSMVDCTDETREDENIISEFEMYGSYCMVNYPGMYEFHDIKTLRHAGYIRGRHINKRLIRMLAYDLDIATFEIYDSPFGFTRYIIFLKKVIGVLSKHKIAEWPSAIFKLLKGEYVSKL